MYEKFFRNLPVTLLNGAKKPEDSFFLPILLRFRRSCKIEEGSSGLKSAIWTPDSLHVLTRADFDVRLTVWSLTSKAVAYIKHTSKAGQDGIAFSREWKMMLERYGYKELNNLIMDC